jgi:hypothetical protein
MTEVVPSQVVAFIDSAFPFAASQKPDDALIELSTDKSGVIRGLLDLLDALPSSLLRLDGPDFVKLTACKATLKDLVERWAAGRHASLPHVWGYGKQSPVTHIRGLLVMCPDELPIPELGGFKFIPDEEVRRELSTDLAQVEQAISGREWKAGTVLGGALIEAMLLWALQQKPKDQLRSALIAVAGNSGVTPMDQGREVEEWHLGTYNAVACHLGVISKSTGSLVETAKDFRNLIHPGRVLRTGSGCTHGTAHACLAAVYRVVEELERDHFTAT